jgi:hypothetical protein
MPKRKSRFEVGEQIIMHGEVKIADEDDDMVVVKLTGYELRVRTHADNLESIGKPPKAARLRDRPD